MLSGKSKKRLSSIVLMKCVLIESFAVMILIVLCIFAGLCLVCNKGKVSVCNRLGILQLWLWFAARQYLLGSVNWGGLVVNGLNRILSCND